MSHKKKNQPKKKNTDRWNLARVSCVLRTINLIGTMGLWEDEDAYAGGFLSDSNVADLIATTLNVADGKSRVDFRNNDVPHHTKKITDVDNTVVMELFFMGKMSVLERNGVPVAYIATNSKSTKKLLTTLNADKLADKAWEN